MPNSRYLTATARLFAPQPPPAETTTHQSDEPTNTPATRPWEFRKERPGQSSPEAYTLTILTCILFFSGMLDILLRLIPLREFHLIWILLIALILTPLAIAEITLISGLAGDATHRLGLLKKWSPSQRTNLFFQISCITYATWATSETTYIKIIGYTWLALIALNTTAAIILSARAAQAPIPPPS